MSDQGRSCQDGGTGQARRLVTCRRYTRTLRTGRPVGAVAGGVGAGECPGPGSAGWLSVVVPAKNEAASLPQLVEEIARASAGCG